MTTNTVTIAITITATPDERFDLTCEADHDFDRLGVDLAHLRPEVASMFMEIGNRLSYKFAQPE